MASKGRRAAARLTRRRSAWANADCKNEGYSGKLGDRKGFKAPGSMTESFPAGTYGTRAADRSRSAVPHLKGSGRMNR